MSPQSRDPGDPDQSQRARRRADRTRRHPQWPPARRRVQSRLRAPGLRAASADAIEHYGGRSRSSRTTRPRTRIRQRAGAAGRAAEAIGCYERVLALEPHSAIAHYNIANVLARERRFARRRRPTGQRSSESRVCRGVQQSRQCPQGPGPARGGRGRLCPGTAPQARLPRRAQQPRRRPIRPRRIGRRADAFPEAVRLAPSFVEARSNLGLARSRTGEPDAAIRELGGARPAPGRSRLTHHLARELLAVGDAPEAAAC